MEEEEKKEGEELKNPGGRVKFKEPINQDGWNTDNDVDSRAISYIAFNPRRKELRVRFRNKKFVQYTYKNVSTSAANRFFRALHPRKKSAPAREDSLGASFWQEVRFKRYQFSRTVLDDVPRSDGDSKLVKGERFATKSGKVLKGRR